MASHLSISLVDAGRRRYTQNVVEADWHAPIGSIEAAVRERFGLAPGDVLRFLCEGRAVEKNRTYADYGIRVGYSTCVHAIVCQPQVVEPLEAEAQG